MSDYVITGIYGTHGVGKTSLAMQLYGIPALKKRQVLATSISGILDPKNLVHTAKLTGLTVEELQTKYIIQIPRTKEELFRREILGDPLDYDKRKADPTYELPKTLIPPGALEIHDETATLFDSKMPDFAMRHFMEARHGVDTMVDPEGKGHTGRIVIISQSPTVYAGLRKSMGGVHYLSKIGMLAFLLLPLKWVFGWEFYRDSWITDTSAVLSPATASTFKWRRRRPEIFKTYDSYSGEGAQENSFSLANTLFSSGWLWFIVLFVAIAGVMSAKSLFNRFGGAYGAGKENTAQTTTITKQVTSSAVPVSSATPIPAAKPKQAKYYVGSYIMQGERVHLVFHTDTEEFVEYSPYDVTIQYKSRYNETYLLDGKELPKYNKKLIKEMINEQNNNKPSGSSATGSTYSYSGNASTSGGASTSAGGYAAKPPTQAANSTN